MIDKKFIWYFVSVIFLAFMAQSCGTVYQSRWKASSDHNKIQQSDERSYAYDASTGIMYRVLNNEDSLFVNLKFSSELTRLKVLGFGLTVWIDPEAKRNRRLGINYPLGNKKHLANRRKNLSNPKINKGEGGMLEIDHSQNNNPKAALKLMNRDIRLIGFTEKGEAMKKSLFQSEIEAELKPNQQGTLVYSLAIPFDKLSEASAFDKNSPVSLGFETGHAEKRDRDNQLKRRRMGGGGPPMGGGAPIMSSRNKGTKGKKNIMAHPEKLWIKKLKLASVDEAKE
ncbi:MAG: hypothetical protein K9I68_08215 [Bacteroidales bacterium]|nr:hypothetical protein [Bacteroidales bacterium]MCF8338830.1 hypothetical protein [Bacteroidales bacterium]